MKSEKEIAEELRQKAEELLHKKKSKSAFVASDVDLLALIHELEVHQIELEMQNEELSRVKMLEEKNFDKYSQLFDFAPTGYFTLSRAGDIIELNLKGAKILGEERSQLLKRRFNLFLSEHTLLVFNLFFEKVFSSKATESCEVTIINDDEGQIHIQLFGLVAENLEDCLITAFDITERKQAEKNAQQFTETLTFLAQYSANESKADFFPLLAQYLAQALDANFVCIDKLDGDGLNARTLSVWNDGDFEDNTAYALKDTPCGDVVGNSVCCFPAGVRKLFPKDTVLQDLEAEGYIGVTLWSHSRIPIGLIAVIKKKPIENQKQAEELLKLVAVRASGELERIESEKALRSIYNFNKSILQTIPFGMDIVDEYGNILFLSDHFLKIVGENTENKKCWELYRDDKKQCSNCPLHSDIKIGDTKVHEVQGVLGGQIFEVFHTGIIFNGQIAMLEIFIDITEQKQTEQELIGAKVRAEESDRLKSAFLANMSHEIRTPMNGILGFTGLLKDKNITESERQQYVGIIEKSGTRLLSIINDIIDISKIESGQMEVSVSRTNVNAAIETFYSFFKPEVEKKGIQFFYKIALASKEAEIITDSNKFDAILSNLVKNAIKYTIKGTIEFGYTLVKRWHDEPIDEPILLFYVKDTGIGIPIDRQDAVFERFIQADISDIKAYQGAGLGLSISKAYVEMLGGRIWLESEPEKGSVFYFTIPYKKSKNLQITAPEIDSTESISDQIRDLKILIVEDDETSELYITNVIKMISREVIHAKTGIEAVEAVRKNPDIDLILLDIRLPDLNGYEAARQIRQFNNEVIIIAQTAYGLSGDRKKAISSGCNDYFSKPIDSTILKETIQKYFKQENL